MIKVSVVIPNYNGIKYLKACLESLSKCEMYSESEVIVVDNASTEEGLKETMDCFPEVKLISLPENGGFSVAVNAGIKNSAGEYVILLNNDTTVSENFIKGLFEAIDSDSKIFAVQSKMVSMQNPEIIDDAGDYYDIFGYAYGLGKGCKSTGFNKKRKIFAACAGAAIYRKSAFDLIGQFDENHFAYLEDIDIGYRALLYGYRNIYEPSVTCFHAGSASSGSRYNEFKIKLAACNSMLVLKKNQPLWQRVVLFPSHFMGVLVKQLFFTIKGFGGIYSKGIKEGLQKRKSIETHFSQKMHKKAFLLGFEQVWNVFRRLQKM